MDQGSLVMEEIDAGEELVREFNMYIPIKVAFWLKASDDEHRYLYIASEQINDANLDIAYGEVLRLASKMNSIYLDPFRVKVISSHDPLAQAAEDIHKRHPGIFPTRFGGTMFGGMSVDEVYLYPPSLSVTVPSH